MKIELNIPKEFVPHYNEDKFKDSLNRIKHDISDYESHPNYFMCGNYEVEVIDMLLKAFDTSRGCEECKNVVDLRDGKKRLDYELAELWTKMKTIRDDKKIPSVYARWCDQVMQMLERFKNV